MNRIICNFRDTNFLRNVRNNRYYGKGRFLQQKEVVEKVLEMNMELGFGMIQFFVIVMGS